MRTTVLAVAAALALAVAGCGSSSTSSNSSPPEPGLVVTGPGVRAPHPPWPPQYTDLAQRIKMLGLPTKIGYKVHHHALVSVYDNGLLVNVPANLGLDYAHNVLSTLHTHDKSGIIHMESLYPYRYTLGDLFAIW